MSGFHRGNAAPGGKNDLLDGLLYLCLLVGVVLLIGTAFVALYRVLT